jgi:dienelactone hydrolase
MRAGLLSAVIAAGLVAAGCANGSDAEAVGTSNPPETTSTMPATTAAPSTAAPSAAAPTSTTSNVEVEESFTQTSDMVYMTTDGVAFLMDVYQPHGEGPWPVVVSFHGVSPQGKDDISTTAVARNATAQGMLVFTPTWLTPDAFPITIETVTDWDLILRCAVSYAQQRAPEFGGDPAITVVDGFSAGAGAALLIASLEPSTGPVPGCATDTSETPISGFVLGDGEYWLHSPNFDGVFDSNPEEIQTRLDALINPASWELNPGADFYLWVAAQGTNPRQIGDSSDDNWWFAERDPDGSIRADLEQLDQYTDGVVTYVDAGQLLAFRLSEAGFDVTLDEYPGGHTTQDKVTSIVGYLLAAAGR